MTDTPQDAPEGSTPEPTEPQAPTPPLTVGGPQGDGPVRYGGVEDWRQRLRDHKARYGH